MTQSLCRVVEYVETVNHRRCLNTHIDRPIVPFDDIPYQDFMPGLCHHSPTYSGCIYVRRGCPDKIQPNEEPGLLCFGNKVKLSLAGESCFQNHTPAIPEVLFTTFGCLFLCFYKIFFGIPPAWHYFGQIIGVDILAAKSPRVC